MSHPPTQHAQLQERAYTTLNTYFTSHAQETLEIEVLPPAFEPTASLLLEDATYLGVPKKILALAFVHARSLFFAHHTSEAEADRTTAHDATRVMLLFDPEHLTAANYRKRHLLHLQRRDGEVFAAALWAERRFMDGILTSPLHRQSKSPTLWAHRAWWLERITPVLSPSPHDAPALFAAELDAVMKAGTRHPKNYYAWLYARRMVRKSGETLGGADRETFLSTCAEKVMAWCMLHVSDISGFSFLTWVLALVDAPRERARIAKAIVSYAMDVRLANESPWTFVRMVVASGLVEEGDRAEIRREMEERREELAGTGDAAQFTERLGATLEWIAKNEAVEDTPEI
jgi:hypothetical protein